MKANLTFLISFCFFCISTQDSIAQDKKTNKHLKLGNSIETLKISQPISLQLESKTSAFFELKVAEKFYRIPELQLRVFNSSLNGFRESEHKVVNSQATTIHEIKPDKISSITLHVKKKRPIDFKLTPNFRSNGFDNTVRLQAEPNLYLEDNKETLELEASK